MEVPPQPEPDLFESPSEEIRFLEEEQKLLLLRLQNAKLRKGIIPASLEFNMNGTSMWGWVAAGTTLLLTMIKGC